MQRNVAPFESGYAISYIFTSEYCGTCDGGCGYETHFYCKSHFIPKENDVVHANLYRMGREAWATPDVDSEECRFCAECHIRLQTGSRCPSECRAKSSESMKDFENRCRTNYTDCRGEED